jgi:hypothetical protein
MTKIHKRKEASKHGNIKEIEIDFTPLSIWLILLFTPNPSD